MIFYRVLPHRIFSFMNIFNLEEDLDNSIYLIRFDIFRILIMPYDTIPLTGSDFSIIWLLSH
jgi:hypothetical protein